MVPQAELHIYYGYPKGNNHNELNNKLKKLISENEGIYEHGRVSVKNIIKEKYKSNFHLYFTNSFQETDCIAIRESLVAGCIPIISNENVFKERDGLVHSEPTNITKSYFNLAAKIAELVNNPKKCFQLREKLNKSPTILSWGDIGDRWMESFG